MVAVSVPVRRGSLAFHSSRHQGGRTQVCEGHSASPVSTRPRRSRPTGNIPRRGTAIGAWPRALEQMHLPPVVMATKARRVVRTRRLVRQAARRAWLAKHASHAGRVCGRGSTSMTERFFGNRRTSRRRKAALSARDASRICFIVATLSTRQLRAAGSLVWRTGHLTRRHRTPLRSGF
jgi:hypothetical protein